MRIRILAIITVLTVLISFKIANAKPLLQTPLNYIRVCYDGQNFCSSINSTNSELVTSDTYIAQVLANEWHGSSTLEAYRAGALEITKYASDIRSKENVHRLIILRADKELQFAFDLTVPDSYVPPSPLPTPVPVYSGLMLY